MSRAIRYQDARHLTGKTPIAFYNIVITIVNENATINIRYHIIFNCYIMTIVINVNPIAVEQC